jgi:hypothetical protein
MTTRNYLKISTISFFFWFSVDGARAQSGSRAPIMTAPKAGLFLHTSPLGRDMPFKPRLQTYALPLLYLENTPAPPVSPLLQRWKADDLPFFCKIEHQMGKKMKTPVKFRLGSVEYVDWLEGKN